jgi:hypothetical protein
MRLLLAAAALCLASISLVKGQSQPPSPAPSKGSQLQKQNRSSNQSQIKSEDGISKSSHIINNQLSTTPSDRTQTSNHGNGEKGSPLKDISDWLLAVFTACLFAVAVLQWLTARGHEKELAAMAGHMQKSLVLTQRPHSIVRRVILDDPSYGNRFISARMGQAPFNPDVRISGRFSLVNRGNGLARVTSSSCAFVKSGPPIGCHASLGNIKEFRPRLLPTELLCNLDKLRRAGSPVKDRLRKRLTMRTRPITHRLKELTFTLLAGSATQTNWGLSGVQLSADTSTQRLTAFSR